MRAKREALLEALLTEMFRRVGREYTPAAVREPDWYTKTTWLQKDEAAFRKWAIARLKKASVARPDREVDMFLLSYGWSYEPIR